MHDLVWIVKPGAPGDMVTGLAHARTNGLPKGTARRWPSSRKESTLTGISHELDDAPRALPHVQGVSCTRTS